VPLHWLAGYDGGIIIAKHLFYVNVFRGESGGKKRRLGGIGEMKKKRRGLIPSP